MLKDPLVVTMLTSDLGTAYPYVADYLGTINVPGDLLEMATIDYPGPGASTRTGTMTDATKVTLTIKHSQSNENKPAETVRTLVRFDLKRINPTTSKPVTLSAYAVIALPQDGTFTTVEASKLGESLALFILQGGKAEVPGDPRLYDTSPGVTLTRLLDGQA